MGSARAGVRRVNGALLAPRGGCPFGAPRLVCYRPLASEISYASLSEADDDVDPAIIDAVAGNPIPALRPMKKPGGGSLV